MEYRFLGQSGLRVSALTLGTMGFGGAASGGWVASTDQDDADVQVRRAIDAGVNLFDTANGYSGGASETLLGAALGSARDQVLISTKVHVRMGEGPNDVGQSRWHILRACEASLKRLGTDRIDVYHVHGFDACTPPEETLRALDDLVRQGKVRYLACSNYAAWQIMRAVNVSERMGLERFVASQSYYSLLARELENEIIPACADQGLGVLVWSPLSGGFLSGKFSPQPAAVDPGDNDPGDNDPGDNDPGAAASADADLAAAGSASGTTRRGQIGDLGVGHIDEATGHVIVDVARSIASNRGVSVAQVAINWVKSRPQVASVIVGARTVAQLDDNLAAANWDLEPDEIELLDQASEPVRPYPQWYQRQFTAERSSRHGAPDGAFNYRFTTDDD